MCGAAVLKKLNYEVGAESGKREVTATGDRLLVRLLRDGFRIHLHLMFVLRTLEDECVDKIC